MIRLSQTKDIPDIITLWNEAFGDSEEDIRFFLDRKYIPENTVVYDDNGKIASVLFLLSGDMIISGKVYPSYYLYAAATLQSYRGKGIMGKMLEYSKNLASGRGIEFICLRPGEKSLFDFYKKHGYKTVFYSKKLSVGANRLIPNDGLSDNPPENLAEIRDNYLNNSDYFRWSEDSIRFALDYNSHFGGTNKYTCNSYLLYSESNDRDYVKECTFTDIRTLYISTNTSEGNSLYNVIFNLPLSIETDVGNYEIHPDGMAISCGDIPAESIKNGYLGLTLE